MANADLEAKFRLTGDVDKVTSLNKGLLSVVKTGAIVTRAITTAGIAALGFVSKFTGAIDAQNDLAKSTGIALSALQGLEYSAQQSGSSVEALDSTLVGLSSKIGMQSMLGKGVFDDLGLSVKRANGETKQADEMLFEIADKFKTMSEADQIGMARKLGIDPSLVQLLRTGSDEIKSLAKESKKFGLVTQEDADKAAEFNDAMDKTKFAMTAVSKSIAVALAPAFTDMANGISDFISENKDLIKEVVAKLITGIAKTSDVILKFIKGIGIIIDSTGGLENGLKLAGAGFLYLERAAIKSAIALMLNPMAWIVAGIIAVVWAVGDLSNALNDGQSDIRDFFNEWLGVDIVPIIKNWYDNVVYYFTLIKDFILGVIDVVKMAWGALKTDIQNIISTTAQLVTNPIGFAMDKITTTPNANMDVKHMATFPKGYNSNITNNINMKVVSSDAKVAGKTASNDLMKQLKITNQNMQKRNGI